MKIGSEDVGGEFGVGEGVFRVMIGCGVIGDGYVLGVIGLDGG